MRISFTRLNNRTERKFFLHIIHCVWGYGWMYKALISWRHPAQHHKLMSVWCAFWNRWIDFVRVYARSSIIALWSASDWRHYGEKSSTPLMVISCSGVSSMPATSSETPRHTNTTCKRRINAPSYTTISTHKRVVWDFWKCMSTKWKYVSSSESSVQQNPHRDSACI